MLDKNLAIVKKIDWINQSNRTANPNEEVQITFLTLLISGTVKVGNSAFYK